jgi:hypothetical protein
MKEENRNAKAPWSHMMFLKAFHHWFVTANFITGSRAIKSVIVVVIYE